MKRNRDKERRLNSELPSPEQIDAEIREAEAEGIHKPGPDFFSEAVEAEIMAGKLDEQLKPTIEDLTR